MMPRSLKQQDEVKMHKFKNEVMEAVRGMKKSCKKWSNLKEDEKRGLKSMVGRIKEGEVVCCVTDKSGRWACETQESYKEACMEELKDAERTPEVSKEEHEKGEKELNSHAAALLRMMGMREGNGNTGDR